MADDVAPKERKRSATNERKTKPTRAENRRAASELEELRRDREVRELAERVALLESQGRRDESIVRELERRGFPRERILHALALHAAEHPEHEHHGHAHAAEGDGEAEESLEEKVADTPRREQNALSELQERMQAGMTGYDLFSRDVYRQLKEMERSVSERGFLTRNEYDALRTFEEELREKLEDPHYRAHDRAAYAQRETAVVESIKRLGGLRIGDSYLRDE